MNNLVVGPLHKGGVDIAEGYHSRSCKPGRKSDCMLLCNSYIISAVGHLIHHGLQGRPCGHGRSDADNFLIGAGQFKDGFTKYILVKRSLGSIRHFLNNLPGINIELTGSMEFCLVLLGSGKTFSLLGNHMQEFGSWDIFHILQDFSQVMHIMPVHRTKITEIEGLKHVALLQQNGFDGILNFLSVTPCVRCNFIHETQQVPHIILDLVIGL